jgi:hypothetical protein
LVRWSAKPDSGAISCCHQIPKEGKAGGSTGRQEGVSDGVLMEKPNMLRAAIFSLLLVSTVHAETDDELRRVIHIQSEAINELNGKFDTLQKTVQSYDQRVDNMVKIIRLLEQQIKILSANLGKETGSTKVKP